MNRNQTVCREVRANRFTSLKADPCKAVAGNVTSSAENGSVQPWIADPYSLLSWWDMEQFSARRFFEIAVALGMLDSGATGSELGEDAAKFTIKWLGDIASDCRAIGLQLSATHAERIKWKVEQKYIKTEKAIQEYLPELRNRIEDELAVNLFMFVPSERAEFFDKPELFGRDVNARFPTIQFDMTEAGNCYAAGRSTACVFHLMRIMETGVQEFGTTLGVTLVNGKVWQVILDEINVKIKALPKDPKTVEMSQAAANLYAVKLAWRNEVMHPKETYTLEESLNLINQVRIFMKHLATVI